METHLPQTKALYFFIKKSNFYNTVYKILRALSQKRQFDTSLANKKFDILLQVYQIKNLDILLHHGRSHGWTWGTMAPLIFF